MAKPGVLRDFLPSLMLAGFGATLEYLAYLVGDIQLESCPTADYSQCFNVTGQNELVTISFWLLFAGIWLLGASLISAIVVDARRARPARRPPPETSAKE